MDVNCNEKSNEWVLVDGEKSLSNIYLALKSFCVLQNDVNLKIEQFSSTLKHLDDKLNSVNERIDKINTKLATIENSIIEKDIREQNRKIRNHDAFSFQPRKNAYT